MEVKKDVRSQLYWNTLLRIPAQGVAFVASIIVARMLMPKDFGIMAIAMMFIGYSNLITNFGFGEAIVQKRITDSRVLDSIFTFDLIISVILSLIFFFIAEDIANYFNIPECKSVIRVMCILFIVSAINALPQAVLRRKMDFKTISLLDFGQTITMPSITLLLAYNNYAYWALVYGQLIPICLITIPLCFKARWFPRIYYKHSLMADVFHFGAWSFFRMQLVFISQHVDTFVIGKWFGAASLGLYDKAMSISAVPYNSVTMNINSVMFSSFSRCKDDEKLLQKQFKKSMTIIASINFPIYLGLIAVTPYFVCSLLGEKWSAMIIPFQIILVGFLFKSFTGLISSLNISIGNYKTQTIYIVYALAVFIASCFLLLHFNITGIAVSFLIFYIVIFTLGINLTLKSLGMSWKNILSAILSCIGGSLIMFSVIQILSVSYFTEHSFQNLIILITVGIVVYAVYILFDKTESTRELKIEIMRDMANKVDLFSKNRKNHG